MNFKSSPHPVGKRSWHSRNSKRPQAMVVIDLLPDVDGFDDLGAHEVRDLFRERIEQVRGELEALESQQQQPSSVILPCAPFFILEPAMEILQHVFSRWLNPEIDSINITSFPHMSHDDDELVLQDVNDHLFPSLTDQTRLLQLFEAASSLRSVTIDNMMLDGRAGDFLGALLTLHSRIEKLECQSFVIRREFVERVKATLVATQESERTEEDANENTENHCSLRSLAFRNSFEDEEQEHGHRNPQLLLLDIASTVPLLEEVEMMFANLTNTCLGPLARLLKSQKHLRRLDLLGNSGLLQDDGTNAVGEFFNAICHHPQLEELSLRYCNVEPTQLGFILEELVIADNTVLRSLNVATMLKPMPLNDCWIRALPRLRFLNHLCVDVGAADPQWPQLLRALRLNGSLVNGIIVDPHRGGNFLGHRRREEYLQCIDNFFLRNLLLMRCQLYLQSPQPIRNKQQQTSRIGSDQPSLEDNTLSPGLPAGLWSFILARLGREPHGLSAISMCIVQKHEEWLTFSSQKRH